MQKRVFWVLSFTFSGIGEQPSPDKFSLKEPPAPKFNPSIDSALGKQSQLNSWETTTE